MEFNVTLHFIYFWFLSLFVKHLRHDYHIAIVLFSVWVRKLLYHHHQYYLVEINSLLFNIIIMTYLPGDIFACVLYTD